MKLDKTIQYVVECLRHPQRADNTLFSGATSEREMKREKKLPLDLARVASTQHQAKLALQCAFLALSGPKGDGRVDRSDARRAAAGVGGGAHGGCRRQRWCLGVAAAAGGRGVWPRLPGWAEGRARYPTVWGGADE